MSQTLASTPPATAVRRFFRRLWDDPESRSTLIGLLGVLIIHLLLWLIAPELLRIDHVAVGTRPHATPREFSIELAPDTFTKPTPPPQPFKFVETNPDAPVNEPDKTTNFAAQSQQVAQEKATPDGRSDRPATEGKKDFESAQILSGQLAKPMEALPTPPAVETPPMQATVAAPRAEQNPLPGFEKTEGENKQSYGSNVARIPDVSRPVPERVEGAKDVPLIEGMTATQPAIDPQRPRPRPTITKQPQVRPAVLAENRFGTSNIGNIAVDARWSNYGSYLQRMIDTVQIEWERILITRKTYPPSGTTVTVKFVLDSEGRIARIIDVHNQSTESAAAACVSGITERAPYGPWSSDMKAMLGDQQEMTFTFYYQ
ncbi:MAG: hypothetical protein Q7S40_29495 [Opitutaceae bacterium]|nr:hypothetical protein [Opitutaceae bacterium]